MFCPNCGTQMPDNASFCPSCGWSKNARQSNFSLGGLKGKTKPVAIIAAVAIIGFVLFKVFTSFGDVGSFAVEMKKIEKQLKDGDFKSILENNIDYENSYTDPSSLASLLNLDSSYSDSYAVGLKLLKGSELEKKLTKVSKELEKSLGIKYSPKSVEKGKIRLNISMKLPTPNILKSEKFGKAFAKVFTDAKEGLSSINIFSSDYMKILAQILELDKPIIELLKAYNSVGGNTKEELKFYIDFYKKDGHWKYKLTDAEEDGSRIGKLFNDWSYEWQNVSSSDLDDFGSKYGLDSLY